MALVNSRGGGILHTKLVGCRGIGRCISICRKTPVEQISDEMAPIFDALFPNEPKFKDPLISFNSSSDYILTPWTRLCSAIGKTPENVLKIFAAHFRKNPSRVVSEIRVRKGEGLSLFLKDEWLVHYALYRDAYTVGGSGPCRPERDYVFYLDFPIENFSGSDLKLVIVGDSLSRILSFRGHRVLVNFPKGFYPRVLHKFNVLPPLRNTSAVGGAGQRKKCVFFKKSIKFNFSTDDDSAVISVPSYLEDFPLERVFEYFRAKIPPAIATINSLSNSGVYLRCDPPSMDQSSPNPSRLVSPVQGEQDLHRMTGNLVRFWILSSKILDRHHKVLDPSALSLRGNTLFFVNHAYNAIQTLKARAVENGSKIPNLHDGSRQETYEWKNMNRHERNILQTIVHFEDVVRLCEFRLVPHYLLSYTTKIAREFLEFQHRCKVLGSEKCDFRLKICLAVERILDTSLDLLGITTITDPRKCRPP